MGKGLSAAARAARVWYAANGDRERTHTTGVWIQKPGRPCTDPVLVVALDSNLLAQELGTNKDLYLARLALHGLAVSDIRFVPGRRTGGPEHRATSMRGGARQRGASPSPAPELTPAERQRVERACEGLPDGLRQSASRAMCASLRRSKGNKDKNTYTTQ